MASEYRITLPKTQQGGFASDPNQEVSNAGSPALDQPVTIKNAAVIGIAAMYAKRVVGTAVKAIIGQTGNDELEMALETTSKLAGYGTMLLFKPAVGISMIATDMFIGAIEYAVTSHKINLENERTLEARGTRRNNSVGGYYG